MSTPDPSANADPQLTPEAKAIIGRARKSFAFSIGVLLLGFIAIGGALVYRALHERAAPASTPAPVYTASSVKIPAGATLISAIAAGGDITVTFRNGAAVSIRIFDGSTGAILREIPVVSQ